jgi:hypothetical protein
MDEQDAARYLGITPERLRELATQGEIRVVVVRTLDEIEAMYFRGEVLRLKEQLRGQGAKSETEEWPDMIDK